MGDAGSGEKTEEPTPERLRKLREEGNVAKSQDVTMAVSLLVVFSVLAASLPWIAEEMIALLKLSWRMAFEADPGSEFMVASLLSSSLRTMLLTCAPVFASAFTVGVVLNLAQVGFMFTTKPITPDINKLNPVNGLKGLFSAKKLVELLKTMLKFTIVTWLSWIALRDAMRDVALIIRGELPVGISIIGSIIWDFVMKIGGAFLIIAAADYFYQKKRYLKEHMMSKYDVKQEYKQSEGDPHHKAERRRVHQEIVNSAGPAAVKDASVVVRNPDHIAIALKYDKEKGAAPTILAKGTRIWAEKILEEAKRYGIPVVRNVPLAQALDKLELGDEIPEALYEAVAEVLNFVYTLSEEQKKKLPGSKK
jgi:flagellar biosynthesis protein FlhB